MDYTALANELLSVRANLLQVPANQKLSKMVQGELFVLNYLITHEKIVHPKELSEKMAVSTARIASLLNHMEGKKLIQRYADKDDNRQVIVILTDTGRQEIHRIRAPMSAPCWKVSALRMQRLISASRKRSGIIFLQIFEKAMAEAIAFHRANN